VLIKKMMGWPPSTFQATEARGVYAPCSSDSLQLQAASLVPSVGPRDAPEVFLLLKDSESGSICSARFKVKDANTAIRLVKALATCQNKKLAELGEIEIREESDNFPGLKGILKK
jgi:hypothetical protein